MNIEALFEGEEVGCEVVSVLALVDMAKKLVVGSCRSIVIR